MDVALHFRLFPSPQDELERKVRSEGCKLSDRDSYCSARQYVNYAQAAAEDSDWLKVIDLCLWLDVVLEQLQLYIKAEHVEQVEEWIKLVKELRCMANKALES